MRVLLENNKFMLHKIVRIAGIIRVAGSIRSRALYEEIRYMSRKAFGTSFLYWDDFIKDYSDTENRPIPGPFSNI